MNDLNADILIEDSRWARLDFEALAEVACQSVLDHLGQTGEVEVSILACNDARIAVLNADFRGKPQPTNVLSWPSEERGAKVAGAHPLRPRPGADGTIELGDIAIAYETCAAEAEESGLSLEHYATHLVVHGVLHLYGYDHERDPDATLMESIETEILGNLGIEDPYKHLE